MTKASLLSATLCAGWLTLQAAAGQTNLPSCAQHYGFVMADHWMVVDLASQLDRALFYAREREGSKSGEYGKLRESISSAEQKLAEARQLYNKIYRTNTQAELMALDSLLQQISCANVGNEKTAERLLQKVGEKASGAGFRAVMVGKEAIEPAWDFQKMVR